MVSDSIRSLSYSKMLVLKDFKRIFERVGMGCRGRDLKLGTEESCDRCCNLLIYLELIFFDCSEHNSFMGFPYHSSEITGLLFSSFYSYRYLLYTCNLKGGEEVKEHIGIGHMRETKDNKIERTKD